MSENSPSLSDRLVDRRTALRLIGLGGVAALAACGGGSSGEATAPTASGVASSITTTGAAGATTTSAAGATSTTVVSTTTTTAMAVDASAATPTETGGPFPSDGTNNTGAGALADVLHDPRALRRDIRSDLDGSNPVDGTPLRLDVRVVRKGSGAAAAGAAVYVWHCSKQGAYSNYGGGMNGGDYSARSFLRGVQVADDKGWVSFDTILPGRYQGRAFHIHFEVFDSAALTTKLLTSQMAMDDDLIDRLYAEAGYDQALRADTDNARDNVFGDGVDHQLLEVSGSVASGLQARFTAVV